MVFFHCRTATLTLAGLLADSVLLEPQFADEFDGTPTLVHGGDLRVVPRADVQIGIGERRMVDEVRRIRSQIETHPLKDPESLCEANR